MTKDQYGKNIDPGEGFEIVPFEELDFSPKGTEGIEFLPNDGRGWTKIDWEWCPTLCSQLLGSGLGCVLAYRRLRKSGWRRFGEGELPEVGQYFIFMAEGWRTPSVGQWGADYKLDDWDIFYWQPFAFTPPEKEKSEAQLFVEKHCPNEEYKAHLVDLLTKWEARGK